jgi:hypothetical protein
MNERPEAFADDPGGAFVFSEDARREIQSSLGDADPSVLFQLQIVAANHVFDAATYYMSPVPANELRRIVTALGRVIRCVDQASPSLQNGLSGQTSANVDSQTDWDMLTRISRLAAQSVRRLERELRFRRKPGRPKNTAREWFAQEVAVVLKRNGVRVTTSRSGRFARVLATMLFETDGTAPEDLFPLIKHGSHYVNDMTPETWRRVSSDDSVE